MPLESSVTYPEVGGVIRLVLVRLVRQRLSLSRLATSGRVVGIIEVWAFGTITGGKEGVSTLL